MSKSRYWDIDPQTRIRYRDDREYTDHFLDLLTDATCCRIRSIGPVGLSLSGGLDSTLLAALATGLLPESNLPQRRLKTFSYVFDELKSCDERAYIQPVVDHLGLAAASTPCDDKWALKDLARWPMERDTIWNDAYSWLVVAVAEAARSAGCRVLLSGQYGEVLFLGGHYWAAELIRAGRWRERGRWIQRNAMHGLLPNTVAERPLKTDFERLTQRGLFDKETHTTQSILAGAQCVELKNLSVRGGPLDADLVG